MVCCNKMYMVQGHRAAINKLKLLMFYFSDSFIYIFNFFFF